MLIIGLLTSAFIWLIAGHALETIFFKAGFRNIPWLVFWLPGINLVLLLYLALAPWPIDRNHPGDQS